METYTDVLLVTANVGSLFDNVSITLDNKSKVNITPGCSAGRGLYLMLLGEGNSSRQVLL